MLNNTAEPRATSIQASESYFHHDQALLNDYELISQYLNLESMFSN
jgi:hypothetical protein